MTYPDSVYSDIEDSYLNTYNLANNDKTVYYEYNNENDFEQKLFPEKDYSTKSPPTKGNTFMPINPNGEDDGDNEVRYNDKVVHYQALILRSKCIL